MQDENLGKPERRRFLKGAVAAGGATAFVALTGNAGTTGSQINPEEAAASQSKGYRLTPHIKDYYESLRS